MDRSPQPDEAPIRKRKTVAEEAAQSPLLQTLVARYLKPDEPAATDTPPPAR